MGLVPSYQQSPIDVCTLLASRNVSDTFIVSGLSAPFCEYSNFCVGVNRRDIPLSCDDAFRELVNRALVLIEEPPIVWQISEPLHHMFQEAETGYVESSMLNHNEFIYMNFDRETRELIDEMATITDEILERIFLSFPRLVYIEEIDGHLLRNFTEKARLLASPIRSDDDDITTYEMQSDWMRKYAWCISMMLWHVNIQPLDQIEINIAAIAPWLHAFLKSTFFLNIVYPDLFQGYAWLLHRAAQFDPLYTDDDRVWYILLDSTVTVQNEVVIHRHANLSWDIVEDVYGYPLHRNGTLFVRHLVQHIRECQAAWQVDEPDRISPLVQNIHRIVYAMEYMAFYDNVDFNTVATESDIRAILDHVHADTLRDVQMSSTALETLLRVFASSLTLEDKTLLLPTLEAVTDFIPMQTCASVKEILVHYDYTGLRLPSLVSALLELDKHDLSLRVTFRPTGIYHPSESRVLSDILDAFVSPFEQLFEVHNSSEDLLDEDANYYRLNRAHAFSDYGKRVQIAFGRIIGLFIRFGNLNGILNRYIKPPRMNASVFETLFFGSRFIQQGVYDIYLAGSFEQSFINGQELCSVLALLSNNTAI